MNEASTDRYVIGIDFGTLSGRAVLVRVSDGAEIEHASSTYKHGVIESLLPESMTPLPPDWALQDPDDYVDVLKEAIPELLSKSRIDPHQVIGIATDFTACTVIPVLGDGTPLSSIPKFSSRPHAYAKLWKHHAAQSHADRINSMARKMGEPWIEFYGGKISSEWEFAKALQLLEEDKEIYDSMAYWVEASDWIVWQLGGTYVRNVCATGFKAIYQDGNYPSQEFLKALNSDFRDFATIKLAGRIAQLGDVAGHLTHRAADWTGLPVGIPVAVGNVDAHVTSASANAVKSGEMVAIMGTSTCLVMVGDSREEVPGMCGIVRGGIVPNAWGYEAGQSGVGDIFAWFIKNFLPDNYRKEAELAGLDVHTYLSSLASKKPVGAHGLVALDWESGNRSTLVDHTLSGVIVGLTLASTPEDVYQCLVESTAFGCRKIIDAFRSAGVPVNRFIAAGGLTNNKYVMQIYADILNMPIDIVMSEQGPALGSAIHAAVAAGAYPDIFEASKSMSKREDSVFVPNPENRETYEALYKHYSELYDYFGNGRMMHPLRELRGSGVK